MTPICEVKLQPKDPKSSVVYIAVRLIMDSAQALDYVEANFSDYEVVFVLQGYRK